MKNNNSSIKPVVAVGIGAALFFVSAVLWRSQPGAQH